MKRRTIISLLFLGMGLGMMTTSCEDMLEPDSERHQYEVAKDTLYTYWGIVKSLQNIAERYIILNECRGDLVGATTNVTDSIKAIMSFGQDADPIWYQDGASIYLNARDYYHVINSCNAYIASCDTFRMTGMDQKYMIKEYAQVEAIRAWTYMQLVNAYGTVPFYTKPMLTTDEINKFMKDPNHATVNAQSLADSLAERLLPMEYVEYYYGYPQYENYSNLCHSSKCMFPVSIVLGDLYLLKGDTESCKKAAQCYYDFLSYKYGGPIRVNSYYSMGNWVEGMDEPSYVYTGIPFTESGALSRNNESITCIPSNRGKLDGKVNVSINRLFGYTASMRASGSGDAASSSIGLQRNIDRELVASKRYENLCDSVPYEIYIGPTADQLQLQVFEGIGDARKSWIPQYTVTVGDDILYGRFVTKQNPGGAFTAVYPMVYRKATVWLRFAEALNRAGFPSYAFAILQKGLCNNDDWYPEVPSSYEASSDTLWMSYDDAVKTIIDRTGEDYAIKDTLWAYVDSIVYDIAEDGATILKVGAIAPYTSKVSKQDLIDQMQAKKDAGAIDTFYTDRINYIADSYQNYPDETTQAICYFLDRREVEKAATTPYLNFKTEYLRGNNATYSINWKLDLFNRTLNFTTTGYVGSTNLNDNVTIGIHSRGGGRLDYKERNSVFNYVDMVAKKVKEAHGIKLDKEAIYSGDYDDYVQEAVEDIIIDEMGMELAFEGTRFFDLSRVAMRRNDPTYLAKHVAMRNGTMDMTLYNYLSASTKNWYLPLPE